MNTDDALPQFQYRGVIYRSDNLRYQPHPDIIHPSVIATDPQWKNPPAPLLMYYAPHDAPGGICLALADQPEGPWWEFPQNPLINRDWPPHHEVSHVSSPHALWHPGERRLFLYYHGENDTTRFAVSQDGVNFEYGGVAVDTSMFEPGVTETSYARVFAWGDAFVMFLMGNCHGTRNIYQAWSDDGRVWHARPTAYLTPPVGNSQMGPGTLFEWEGAPHLICFGNRADSPQYQPVSDLYIYRLSPDLTPCSEPRLLLSHEAAGPENLRINDPCIYKGQDQLYLFVNVGRRLFQQIGLAVAPNRASNGAR